MRDGPVSEGAEVTCDWLSTVSGQIRLSLGVNFCALLVGVLLGWFGRWVWTR